MTPELLAKATGLMLLAMPVTVLASALPGARTGVSAALIYRRRVASATVLVFVFALLAAVMYAFGARSDVFMPTIPLPGMDKNIDLHVSIAVNGMTLLLAALVSFVLMIIARYSIQYLNGDPQQARFFRLLGFTGGWFLLVVIAGNMALFTFAILMTGFTLHRLLGFYPERPRAIMVTHKKSIFSRTADTLLMVATVLIGLQVGSMEFSAITAFVHSHEHLPLAMHVAAWLIVLAAILKSAQFPFHGWLIQVMEAPTPVSALMHAGVVYSGAIIVLRTSHLLVADGYALILLAIVGLTTLIIASLVMLTQSAIKSSLAWSTAAQLGFMLLELGLGLFALGLLHLVGHSLYKAHAFLSSGGIADQLRQPKIFTYRPVSLVAWFATLLGSLVIVLALISGMGLSLREEPTLWALVVIIALATAQLVLKVLSYGTGREVVTAIATATAMSAIYFVLHTLFMHGFAQELAPLPTDLTPLHVGLIALTIVGFFAVAWLQGPGRERMSLSTQSALFIHLYNGLYVDRWVERLSYRLWPEKVGRMTRMPDTELSRKSHCANDTQV
ncbi:MAG TPA: NADH-quinone oxidoreductase subunit L [Halothiobacillus sp.]|nr:NADH-quinone oxidoreductase subunit L [Halothiobacillus sp.]